MTRKTVNKIGRVRPIQIGTRKKQSGYEDEFIVEMRDTVGKTMEFKSMPTFPGWYDSVYPYWTFHESWIEFMEEEEI